jgi:catechol 2,3-dioxygenase
MTQKIHPEASLGHVHYTVANMQIMTDFYQAILGFSIHWQRDNQTALGAGKEDLLVLTELPGAQPSRNTTGLYHTAFLYPSPWELAQVLTRIAETKTPIDGTSDHGTHWAIYLADPEGNGIELAWDRPQEEWPDLQQAMKSGHMDQVSRPLYPEQILEALKESTEVWRGAHADTRVGHVHLYVATIPQTKHFYGDVLGFDTPIDVPEYGVAMFSVGGYHHHIGANTWKGVGLPSQSATSTGLRYFSIVLPSKKDVRDLHQRLVLQQVHVLEEESSIVFKDPSGIGIKIFSQQK